MPRCFQILLLGISILNSCSPSNPHNYVIFSNVNVVDVVNGKIEERQTVVFKDSLIHFIGEKWEEVALSTNVQEIDGTGKFLMPGLWDMHFHLAWENSNDSLLFPPLLANGITGIRDMGGDLSIQNKMKKLIVAKPTAGPEIFGAGPIIDGNPPVMPDFSIAVDSSTDITHLLDSLKKAGADFIKIYSLIKEPELSQIAVYTKQNGLAFAGHLSEYVEPEKSIALGQKSIEHLSRLEDLAWKESKRYEKLVDLMVKENTWLCPTLIIYEIKHERGSPNLENLAYNKYIHPLLMAKWEASNRRWEKEHQEQSEKRKHTLDGHCQKDIVKMLTANMHDKGVKILAGSDFAGMPYIYPGIGLHQELYLLNRAGLSPAEALATATINPAIFLGVEGQYGSVEAGKTADVVLLNKNPLEYIKNTRNISLVFRKGEIAYANE